LTDNNIYTLYLKANIMELLAHPLVQMILVVIGSVIVFLLLREVTCWYFKINERIALMKEQNDLFTKLLANIKPDEKTSEQDVKTSPNTK